MSSGIYAAAAGAMAQSNALDATANNIANASTAGFKGERVQFREALANAQSPDLTLVSTGATRIDNQFGAMQHTDNPLDIALDGDGYFGVQTPNGTRYTRNGGFQLDAGGQIVTADGFAVRGEGGAPIAVPEGTQALAVATDGTISADGEEIGKLELVKFNAAQLRREGGALFAARGAPIEGEPPTVRAGTIEQSNVNVVRGVVDLVKVSRTYESLMKMIQTYHDCESRAAKDLGGPK